MLDPTQQQQVTNSYHLCGRIWENVGLEPAVAAQIQQQMDDKVAELVAGVSAPAKPPTPAREVVE